MPSKRDYLTEYANKLSEQKKAEFYIYLNKFIDNIFSSQFGNVSINMELVAKIFVELHLNKRESERFIKCFELNNNFKFNNCNGKKH